jgi:outer membrane protein assembly factor BamB
MHTCPGLIIPWHSSLLRTSPDAVVASMSKRPQLLAYGLFAALVMVSARSPASADNWPRFRGPTGMGITSERDLPLTWGGKDDESLLWIAPLPGFAERARADQNQSSPIVWEEKTFVTTAFWPAGRDQKEFPEQHVACFSLTDADLEWDIIVEPGPWKLADLRGGYAAPTPATDGERVYVLFGSAVLLALDFDGRQIWRHELADPQSFDVAIASSPILYRGAVILLADKGNQKSVLTAYDARTGETLWEQKRPGVGFCHSTPVLAEIAGRTQILIAASNALQGIDPENGEVLWWCDGPGDVCSPVTAGDLAYTDSGRGGPGMLVEARGTGDLSKSSVKWRIGNIPEGLSSPVIADDHLYRLHNPGVLKCVNLTTGKEAFAKRVEGVSIASSPIVTHDGLVYLASAGKTLVLKAGPSFELLATNDLGESSPASAAVSGKRLILKGREHLFCIGKKP